jgi:hypothetical protein
MKRIALLLALFCLGLSMASFAIAKDGPGKGKKTSTTSTDPATCHPKVSAILKGTFVSGGGTSFTMDVTRSNFHAKDLVGEPLTLMVDAKTKFRRKGHAELSDFMAGDRLNVQARTCKVKKQKNQNSTTTTTGSTPAPAVAAPAMLAKRVDGHPAKASAGTTTTTTTPAP